MVAHPTKPFVEIPCVMVLARKAALRQDSLATAGSGGLS